MKFNILILLAALLLLYACALVVLNFYSTPKPQQTAVPVTEFNGELWSPHIGITSTPETKIKSVQAIKQCLHVGDNICQ